MVSICGFERRRPRRTWKYLKKLEETMQSLSHDGEDFGRDSNRILPEYDFKPLCYIYALDSRFIIHNHLSIPHSSLCKLSSWYTVIYNRIKKTYKQWQTMSKYDVRYIVHSKWNSKQSLFKRENLQAPKMMLGISWRDVTWCDAHLSLSLQFMFSNVGQRGVGTSHQFDTHSVPTLNVMLGIVTKQRRKVSNWRTAHVHNRAR
jgi:hypothetical protein